MLNFDNQKNHTIRDMAYKTFDPEIAARKKKNVDIFRETTSLIQAGGFTTPSGKQYHQNAPAWKMLPPGDSHYFRTQCRWWDKGDC